MTTTKKILDKIQVTLTQPEMRFTLPKGYPNVTASHLKWLTYVTSSNGGSIMSLDIFELEQAGIKLQDTNGGNNKRYYVSMPLDPSSQVTNIYANFTGALDKDYDLPISINTLTFKVLINGILANDITPSNPIQLEIVLYK